VDCLKADTSPALFACLDNFIAKAVATMHCHTILRDEIVFENIPIPVKLIPRFLSVK
jgi:hypothetical protein